MFGRTRFRWSAASGRAGFGCRPPAQERPALRRPGQGDAVALRQSGAGNPVPPGCLALRRPAALVGFAHPAAIWGTRCGSAAALWRSGLLAAAALVRTGTWPEAAVWCAGCPRTAVIGRTAAFGRWGLAYSVSVGQLTLPTAFGRRGLAYSVAVGQLTLPTAFVWPGLAWPTAVGRSRIRPSAASGHAVSSRCPALRQPALVGPVIGHSAPIRPTAIERRPTLGRARLGYPIKFRVRGLAQPAAFVRAALLPALASGCAGLGRRAVPRPPAALA